MYCIKMMDIFYLDNFKEFNRNNNEFNDKKYDESLDVRQNNY